MKLPPFLTEWPYGEIMVTGHRIGLYSHVIFYHNLGQSPQCSTNSFRLYPWNYSKLFSRFMRSTAPKWTLT